MKILQWITGFTMAACCSLSIDSYGQKTPADYVNPLLGTATLWDSAQLGYKSTHRAWGAEVFPGSSVPNAMVQLTPVTQFKSGSGYQYEDSLIYGFAHSSKGHWNLCNIPLMPATGNIDATNYASGFTHRQESATPGYYQVVLDKYQINVELTSTLRCAYHRYQYKSGASQEVIADLSKSNERVKRWDIKQVSDHSFAGFQETGSKMYFYAVANHQVRRIDSLKGKESYVPVIHFDNPDKLLELKIGFSFVSVAGAKRNLENEMLAKSFPAVRREAKQTWNHLLSKISIKGGTERQKGIFYSCLYRSFLWPVLRSDVNGDFTDEAGKVVNKGFSYYSIPSLWDTYRNKLVLMAMLQPKVTANIIQSLVDRGNIKGFIPTFFHGDHAAVYIAGSYLRGIRGFDVKHAYKLLLRNATVEGGTRPYIQEYIDKGYISTPDIAHPTVPTKAKAGVTKTLEYAYDDYAVALLAKSLGDSANYRMLMKRTGNYKNVFDSTTGFMRGRLSNGDWVKNFDPKYPYYEYMYREANAWQSSFFAPQDVSGLIQLYNGKKSFERKLDQFFTIPWNGVEAANLTGFIGQYCQGNQPDHSNVYLYYFVNKQEKSQVLLDSIMNHFYDMGKHKLAYSGMDDAGEMSAWYVFNAMGFYPFSPADPNYIVTVPLFDQTKLQLGDKTATIQKEGHGKRIKDIRYGGQALQGYFIKDSQLKEGKSLIIQTK